MLSCCVQGRYDETSAEILLVVIDILRVGGRVRHLAPVVVTVSEMLKKIAMGCEVDDEIIQISELCDSAVQI